MQGRYPGIGNLRLYFVGSLYIIQFVASDEKEKSKSKLCRIAAQNDLLC